jgi:hypothetical protein
MSRRPSPRATTPARRRSPSSENQVRLTAEFIRSRPDLESLPYEGLATGAQGRSDPISMEDFQRGEFVVGIRHRGHTYYFSIASMRQLIQSWEHRMATGDGRTEFRNPVTNLNMRDDRASVALYQVRPRERRRSASPSRTIDLTGGRRTRRRR